MHVVLGDAVGMWPVALAPDVTDSRVAGAPRAGKTGFSLSVMAATGRLSWPRVGRFRGSGTHFVVGCGAVGHAGLRIRLRRRSNLARPNI